MTIDFPALDGETSAEQLLAACVAGEWADRGDVESCRLVEVEWPDRLPGPAFPAPPGVSVGAIVKPALGLAPAEAATVAAELATGGAVLVKDDELQRSSPERVRAVNAALPEQVLYAANVTGPVDSLLARAERAVELGAGALMVNAFAQGLDSLRALRGAELGVPIFAHRVGAALWAREARFGVAPAVIAELTRLCGADFVQVGSFTGTVYDTADDVRAQIEACHRGRRAVAVIGGGVGPENAAAQLDAAHVTSAVMLLLGSAAYEGGSPEEAVRATVDIARSYSARPKNELEIA